MDDKYLTREEWRYSSITPGAIYETHVCALIDRNLDSIFPEYFGWRMEPLIVTFGGNVKPDLILIRRDFLGWALVEVEVEGHSVSSHILPQLHKLSVAQSNDDIFSRVCEAIGDGASKEDVSNALSGKPRVYLVVHGKSTSYSEALNQLNVEAIDIEIHQGINKVDDYILRVHDRTAKFIDLGLIASRVERSAMKYLWMIKNFNLYDFSINQDKVEVLIDGTRSFWSIKSAGTDVILRQPTDLSDLDAIIEAKVLFNPENKSLHLVSSRRSVT